MIRALCKLFKESHFPHSRSQINAIAYKMRRNKKNTHKFKNNNKTCYSVPSVLPSLFYLLLLLIKWFTNVYAFFMSGWWRTLFDSDIVKSKWFSLMNFYSFHLNIYSGSKYSIETQKIDKINLGSAWDELYY